MATYRDLDTLLREFADGGVPGCALQIAQRGKVIYEGYFGYSNLDAKTPVTEDSVFGLASMSKIPLYTTMMMLYERGEFNLTDPISNYFPEWRDMKKYVKAPNGHVRAVPCEKQITISDILSMKAGLPYCNSMAPSDDLTITSMQGCMRPLFERGTYTIREQIRAVSEAVLAAEPGERWIYGFSSELAAGVIEEVCGKSIDDVFQEFLFDPLEMRSMRSDPTESMRQNMVKMYRKKGDGEFEPFSMFGFSDQGGKRQRGWARLYSNTSDYTKLMQMLANGGAYHGVRIMSAGTINMMRTNGLTPAQLLDFEDTYNRGYGYGYGVRTLLDKNKANHNGSLGAFGWTGGFGTWCEADPEDGVSIVYMHNMSPNEEVYYHHRMRTVAYGCIE